MSDHLSLYFSNIPWETSMEILDRLLFLWKHPIGTGNAPPPSLVYECPYGSPT